MDSSQSGNIPTAKLIWTICQPVIALVGILGNITTILVFTRKQKPSSTTLCLTWVAVADLTSLVVIYPRWWLIYVFSTDIRRWNDVVCKMHMFISYTVGIMSNFILAAVTVERIISVSVPYKSKIIGTFGSPTRVLCGLLVLNICLNGHVIYGFSLVDHTPTKNNNLTSTFNTSIFQNNSTISAMFATRRTCDWTRYKHYADFYVNIYYGVIIVIQSVVIQSIFVVGCVIIRWKMTMSQRLHNLMKHSAGMPSRLPLGMNKRYRQITTTLLLVVLVYLVCTIPIIIFLALRHTFVVDNRMTEVQEILWAVLNQLYFFNKSVNFILFSITGQRFRQDVKELCGCTKSREMIVQVVADSSL